MASIMRITVLIDNNPDPDFSLHAEHGLSLYFEADGYKWLFDTGASDSFYKNAFRLGIDISAVDFLVLSHGHNDHTGGLEQFIRVNSKAVILISGNIRDKFFYSYRSGISRDISVDHQLVKKHIERFDFIDKNKMISGNVGIVCEIPWVYPLPKSNSTLYQSGRDGDIPDDFRHELVLAADIPQGFTVFSGCSHNGILNILSACSDYFGHPEIKTCIGGMHLMDGDPDHQFETESEIDRIGRLISDKYPGMDLITGHCTGAEAKKRLQAILGEKFRTFHSGCVIE